MTSLGQALTAAAVVVPLSAVAVPASGQAIDFGNGTVDVSAQDQVNVPTVVAVGGDAVSSASAVDLAALGITLPADDDYEAWVEIAQLDRSDSDILYELAVKAEMLKQQTHIVKAMLAHCSKDADCAETIPAEFKSVAANGSYFNGRYQDALHNLYLGTQTLLTIRAHAFRLGYCPLTDACVSVASNNEAGAIAVNSNTVSNGDAVSVRSAADACGEYVVFSSHAENGVVNAVAVCSRALPKLANGDRRIGIIKFGNGLYDMVLPGSYPGDRDDPVFDLTS